jgi:CBS domain-containing protein
MEDLLRIAKRPATSTHPGATVQQACETMMAERVGALVVLDEGRLVGILSERDVVARIVVPRRDAAKTLVSEVMTREVRSAKTGMTSDEAMEVMHTGRFRHLPVLDAAGQVVGMLSMRHLLRLRVEELDVTSQTLINYIAADGPGG